MTLLCLKSGKDFRCFAAAMALLLDITVEEGFRISATPNNIMGLAFDESGPLKILVQDIEQSMYELGLAREEKRFSPHLNYL